MRNRELKLQELADRLVNREVFYCVSSLMWGISKLMWEVPYKKFDEAFGEDPEETLNLFRQEDWESAATEFIEDDADFDDLEKIAEEYGDWDEILERLGIPKTIALPTHYVCSDCLLPLVNGDFSALPDDREQAVRDGMEDFPGDAHPLGYEDEEFSRKTCDCCGTTLAGARHAFSDGSDTEDDVEERVKFVARENENIWKELRGEIESLVDEQDGGYKWVCQEFDLEPDEIEVYEHWIVSGWLAKRLEEKGYITGEFAGLTIWGRTTTGQAISMDYVIRQIAAELWPEELAEVKEEEHASN